MVQSETPVVHSKSYMIGFAKTKSISNMTLIDNKKISSLSFTTFICMKRNLTQLCIGWIKFHAYNG